MTRVAGSEKRIRLLGRTCEQLEVVGAAMLGSKLRGVLEQGWGPDTTHDHYRSATTLSSPLAGS